MTDFLVGDSAGRTDGAADDMIKDSSEAGFMADVIEASDSRPVLVCFQMALSDVCKQFLPVLEGAVRDTRGKVALVKMDMDKSQSLAAQLRVQTVPSVFVFFRGQPVHGFQGPLPPAQLKEFLDQILKATGASDDDPLEAALAQADESLTSGEPMQAARIYQQILQHQPGHPQALVGLAEATLALGQNDQAQSVIDSLDAAAGSDDIVKNALAKPDLKQRFDRVRTTLALAAEASDAGDAVALEARVAETPDDMDTRFDLALAYQGRGDAPAAAEQLLAIILRDREWQDGKAREQLLKLFEAAGPTDPFTLKYRRRLSSILFS